MKSGVQHSIVHIIILLANVSIPPQVFCMWVHIERLINHFSRWGPLGKSSYRVPLPAGLTWLVLRDMVLLCCCCDIWLYHLAVMLDT